MQSDIQEGDLVFLRSYQDMKNEFGLNGDGDITYGNRMRIYDAMIPRMGKFYNVESVNTDLPFPRYSFGEIQGFYFGREALVPEWEMKETIPWEDVFGKDLLYAKS